MGGGRVSGEVGRQLKEGYNFHPLGHTQQCCVTSK